MIARRVSIIPPRDKEGEMSKNQGIILDIGISAAFAATSCYLLSWVDFHPVFVFFSLTMARYKKLTLTRRVIGLRNCIATLQQVKAGDANG